MKVEVAIINAFVDDNNGGNPAGVVLNADTLTSKQKLAIANKVGLSETAFVSQSNSADFKLEFYTPQKQIAHCGHATIATFSHLSQLGMVPNANTSKETIDGNRSIQVKGDFAYMEQLAPKYYPLEQDSDQFLQAINVAPENVISNPIIVNTGNAFLLVGVNNIATLNSLSPNQNSIETISEEYDLIGFYAYTLETNRDGRDASARMFAPRYGIEEEAATGMAAGPLACVLHDVHKLPKNSYKIEQGYSMKPASPSCIDVSLQKDGQKISSLIAGGKGIVSRFAHIEI